MDARSLLCSLTPPLGQGAPRCPGRPEMQITLPTVSAQWIYGRNLWSDLSASILKNEIHCLHIALHAFLGQMLCQKICRVGCSFNLGYFDLTRDYTLLQPKVMYRDVSRSAAKASAGGNPFGRRGVRQYLYVRAESHVAKHALHSK